MRAPGSTYLFLAIGLVAASQSGNLIRIGHAHPVAVAAWRLIVASAILLPLAGRELGTLRALTLRQWVLLTGAGAALAAHLVTWIAAVQLTTVSNAAIFFAVNPVMTALAARVVFGERLRAAVLVSAALGLAGVAMIGWNDHVLAPGHLVGDGISLICSAFFTVYFLAGKHVRNVLSTPVYVASIYGIAGGLCFALLAALGVSATGYDTRTWVSFGLLALVPTVIGHTSFNHALRRLDAGWVSCATLSEPPLAAGVAWVAWNEAPTPGAMLGYVVIAASVLMLVWDARRITAAR